MFFEKEGVSPQGQQTDFEGGKPMTKIKILIGIVFVLVSIGIMQFANQVLAANQQHHQAVYQTEKRADNLDVADIDAPDGYQGINFFLDETDEQVIKENGKPAWAHEYLNGAYAIRYVVKQAHGKSEWLTMRFNEVKRGNQDTYELTSAVVEAQPFGVCKQLRLYQHD